MTLKKYLGKRNLKKSHEPSADVSSSSGSLNFCVQKHAARTLHYDFRLEYKGVLLSWAVPKGPSLNPKDKRLAIKVEDHPLAYQYFEGTIPKGNYGAGTVEIWDKGTYQILGAHSRTEAEKILSKGLKEGHFSFMMNGEKLKGEFVLRKLKQDADDNSWLLFKKQDSYATDKAEDPEIPFKRNRKHTKLPDFIPPMLATLVDQPFDDEDWLFEIKWDGYRALAFVENGKVQLKSRAKIMWNEKFPEIIRSLEKIKGQVILDGELVVIDEKGKSHFQLMQNYQKKKAGQLCYYVFDILHKDGEDLRELPLIKRKEILKKFIQDLSQPLVRLSDYILKNGIDFFKEASKEGLEGIVGKNLVSTYQSKRSRDWVKIKTSLRQEVVIGGFTAPRGSREKFGALLVGVYDEHKNLNYIGHVGGGFDRNLLKDIYDRLQPLIQNKSPFNQIPKTNSAATWVKPKLICEVSFSEWTQDNSMRHPIFEGLRMDKPAKSVKKETAEKTTKIKPKKSEFEKTQNPTLTHLEKIYWPQEKYTKGDLIHYYESIADYILPYLKDRPIMLHRYPNGIEGKDFYQKNLDTHPEWITTHPVQHEGKIDHYLFINDLQSLLYAINLGSIDLHPFLSRYQHLENPDFCVIDLDPHDVSFKDVVDTALTVHEILEKIKVKHFCKTSGGKGLHILIPFHGKYDYTQSRQFAEIIGYYVHEKLPDITSLERNPKKRPNKIYIDCLQNRTGQSIVSPYSIRPRPHAIVSTPLLWEEVNDDLDLNTFNINTIARRLKKHGDLLKGLLGPGINLAEALKRLKS